MLDALPSGVLGHVAKHLDPTDLAALWCCSSRLLLQLQDAERVPAAKPSLPLCWKDKLCVELQAASRVPGSQSNRVTFTLLPQYDAKKLKHVTQLCTDGLAVALLDQGGHLVQGVVPPRQATQGLPQRPAGASLLPQGLHMLPSLSRVVYQPAGVDAQATARQLFRAGPQAGALIMPDPVNASSYGMEAERLLTHLTSNAAALHQLLQNVMVLDLSGQRQYDDTALCQLLMCCPQLRDARLADCNFGGACARAAAVWGQNVTSLDLSGCRHMRTAVVEIGSVSALSLALTQVPGLQELTLRSIHITHLTAPAARHMPPSAPCPPAVTHPLPEIASLSIQPQATPRQPKSPPLQHPLSHHATPPPAQQHRPQPCPPSDPHPQRRPAATATGKPPPSDTCHASMGPQLPGLRRLDLSGCEGLTPAVLASLLQGMPQLCHLHALECRSLAAATGGPSLMAVLSKVPQLPSFHNLALGWGAEGAIVRLLCGASPCLTRLTLGMGASVTDTVLEAMATACQHLQVLDLRLCTVSDAGVGRVVSSCHKLGTLKLLACVGPFGSPLVQGIGPGWWGLQELHLVGGAVSLSPDDLRRLLGGMRQHQLHTLALSGVRGVTEDLLDVLAHEQCNSLQYLRLEDCTPLPSTTGSGGNGEPFSASSMMTTMKACTQLRSLALRHCCPVPAGFIELAREQCCLLSSLLLDSCDLESGGINLPSDAHHPLYKVQLCKCKAVQGAIPAVACRLPRSRQVVDLNTGVQQLVRWSSATGFGPEPT